MAQRIWQMPTSIEFDAGFLLLTICIFLAKIYLEASKHDKEKEENQESRLHNLTQRDNHLAFGPKGFKNKE